MCIPNMDIRAEEDGYAGVAAVFEAHEAWRYDDARRAGIRILEEQPNDPVAMAALGDIKLHDGDYRGALHLYREARRAGVPAALLRNEGLADAAAAATDGYREHFSQNFVVRHPPGRDAILIPFAQETLEQALNELSTLFGFRPESRTLVELYPSARTLAKVSSLTESDIQNSGTIALCKWNRLMATSPRGVVFGYAWRDTLAHELAHLLIGGASRNRAPIWLHEGLAKFTETAWRGSLGDGISVDQQERLRKAAREGELIPFARMHPSMAKLPTQEQTSLAFAEVFTFVEYLVDRKGWSGIRRVLRLLAEGRSDAEALAMVYGSSFEALERAWKQKLPGRAIRRPSDGRAVKGNRELTFKSDPDAPDDELDGLSAEGRRYARAADLLFHRGRLQAAQKELEKAQATSPSPQLAAKLAFVALQTGDLEAAERAARQAVSDSVLAGPNVTLAEILVQRGKLEEARIPLQRAVDVNPFDPRIHQLTLAVEGASGDPDRIEHARQALALMSRPFQADHTELGVGALVRIEGPPFSRVLIAPAASDPQWVATRAVTPTAPIPIRPGRYRLKLIPPSGPASERVIDILDGDGLQTITGNEPNGS